MTKFNPRDHYFEKAKAMGFRARSVFKLQGIDQSLKLIKPDSVILDLGCAPGSWLQYTAKKIGSAGAVLGVDLTPIRDISHQRVKVVVDDCFLLTGEKIRDHMAELVPNFHGFDVVLSDMAPKTSGIKHADQARSLELADKALSIAEQFLKNGGHAVIKVFASSEAGEFVLRMKKLFSIMRQIRPEGVRAPSKEFYAVGINKKQYLSGS